jgi:hypothetical protein
LDAYGQIGFVGVSEFGPIIEELVLARSSLGLVDVYGLGLHEFQKWVGLIRVLGSFSYKDLSKLHAKFEFMMGGYKTELCLYIEKKISYLT